MSWDDLLDLVATILIVWMAVAILVGVVVGKAAARGDRLAESNCPDNEVPPEG